MHNKYIIHILELIQNKNVPPTQPSWIFETIWNIGEIVNYWILFQSRRHALSYLAIQETFVFVGNV